MSEWINYKESPPPMKKREYWVYDAKNKRVTYDVFKHRVIKGGGIYADYGYCFSLILDNNASHYMPIVKGEGKPEPPKGGAGMSDIVDITENLPHKVSEVICVKCGHRWIAVRPEDSKLRDLECPNCTKIGYAIETGEEIKE